MAGDSERNVLEAIGIKPITAEAGGVESKQLVIDITRGLLQINEKVLHNLSRFLPASEAAATTRVRQHLARLLGTLDSQPDTVLSATQDDQLESLLTKFGPGDPFSSLPFLSVEELLPGDIIVRCSSALSSQMTEVMIWSRYTHTALYTGNGRIIDATWQSGVKMRNLADLLGESNRVGVLRVKGLTPELAQAVVRAAQSRGSWAYNFEAVKVLGVQKLEALSGIAPRDLGYMIDILGRAESLPAGATGQRKYACSELVGFAYKAANITLSNASGFTPGDIVRLGQAGYLQEVGRLRVQ